MRLMTIEVQRFRRFREKAKLDVPSRLVAMVGPNEAGKSSLLSAMLALNSDGALEPLDHTRGESGTTWVRASYVLDETDYAALKSIPGAKKVKWWTYEKRLGDKTVYYHFFGAPDLRDLTTRHALAKQLEAFRIKEHVERLDKPHNFGYAQKVTSAIEDLQSTSETLETNHYDVIRDAGAYIGDLKVGPDDTNWSNSMLVSQGFHDLGERLRGYNEGYSPRRRAFDILDDRRPAFLLYTDDHRTLSHAYNLDEVFRNTPASLDNLTRLANLDLAQLRASIDSGDTALREQLLERARAVLEGVFHPAWRQSKLSVKFATESKVLKIQISEPDFNITSLAERSAGLLSFVALRAFLACHQQEEPPILLVDEAETHLHYDAQADLINVFMTQNDVAKIIYTTHSAGCLPRDLGTGIRVVEPLPESSTSRIRNSIWTDRESGFTPLALGMGATTFAFLPARHVLLVEGVTDAMLLPTLFREATGLDELTFQIAPGLSVASSARRAGLVQEGGAVAFLTDGDQAGLGFRRELVEGGVNKGRVFGLDSSVQPGMVLEDLLSPEQYTIAFNTVLDRFQLTANRLTSSELPATGRAQFADNWYHRNGLGACSKKVIMQELIDQKADDAAQGRPRVLIDPTYRRQLRSLHSAILKSLGPP